MFLAFDEFKSAFFGEILMFGTRVLICLTFSLYLSYSRIISFFRALPFLLFCIFRSNCGVDFMQLSYFILRFSIIRVCIILFGVCIIKTEYFALAAHGGEIIA